MSVYEHTTVEWDGNSGLDASLASCFLDLDTLDGSAIAAEFIVVARRDVTGRWAAYFGPSSWGAMRVARDGNKVLRLQAQELFPNIEGGYRD